MGPFEMHEVLGLRLPRPAGLTNTALRGAIASVTSVLGDAELLAHAAWFDYGTLDGVADVASGVHIRLVSEEGVVTVDHSFGFDGQPSARLLPWSRVTALRVTSVILGEDLRVTNVWLETELEPIEFSGAEPHLFGEIASSIRRCLAL